MKSKSKALSKIESSPRPMRPMPMITLTAKDLPEIKSWEVGKKYDIEATVEMVNLSKGDIYGPDEGKGEFEARFKIKSIKAC